MSRSLPPMNWFRVFEAAARHLKFTAAAQELGITQSAVSQQIRLLELRLGTELFLRQARGLLLTDAGRKLLPMVSQSIGQLTAATQMFDAGPEHDLITVATSVSIAQFIIAPNVQSFHARYPKTRVRLLSTIWADDFKSTLADVEIRFGSLGQAGPNARRLGPDGLIVVGASHMTQPISSTPLIDTVGTSENWRHWAAAADLEIDHDPSLIVDSYGMAITLAQQGAGLALAPRFLVAPLIGQGVMVQRHPVEIAPTEGYFLRSNSNNAAAQHFCDWVIGVMS